MIVELLITAFLVIGGLFGIVGSYGLIKLTDAMQRLHGPTKSTTLGVGGVLIASMLYFGFVDHHVSFHELLITLFLFITAPITAHFMAQTYLRMHTKESELPPTGRRYGWSIYQDPPVVEEDE
ncbi:Na+/H+ antiporter subunit G [Tropicibacter naphthalenivorans]|uniref:Multiple resistance and pH homeostasis protein G n=1 Tax=Tropicibacter naphthalenivorans TaxID=441103 RepID=A0A0P1GHK4_9RHOB|nr:Na+/H+ antiporter subunit G [Tropicibacter naphthalenivorans]CUH81079.1 Multiple resistance and pH homeostasis protein G [Tropicibacter naphthalenivorans]SMC97017.1 multisubunit potassium/proton antiporter, PhaG subunit [Tropicibacter naphthalenivorans]